MPDAANTAEETLMKAREALIAWSGLDDPNFGGTVMVSRVVNDGQVERKADGPMHELRFVMEGSDSLVGLFQDFQYLVVEEHLDPEAVHRAFLAIDEYAALSGYSKPKE